MKARKLITFLLALTFVLGLSVAVHAEVVFELPLRMNSFEQDNVMGWGTDGSYSNTYDIGLTVEDFARGRYLVLETHYILPNWENNFWYVQLMLNGNSPQGFRSWEFGSDIGFESGDPRVAALVDNMIVFDLNPLKMGAGHDDMYFTDWENVQLHIGFWDFPIPQIGLTRAFLSTDIPAAPSTDMFEIVFDLPMDFNSFEQDNVMGWGTDGSDSNTRDIGLTVEDFARGRYFIIETPYVLPNWDNNFWYVQLMLNGNSPEGFRNWEFGSDIGFDSGDPRVARLYENMVVFDLDPLKRGAGHEDMYFTDWEDVQLHIGFWDTTIPEIGISRAFLATGIPGQPSTMVVAAADEPTPYEAEPTLVDEPTPAEPTPAEPTPDEPTPVVDEPTPAAPATTTAPDSDGLSVTVIIIIVVAAVVVIAAVVFFVIKGKKK
ncbi:MAG: hypothetical protein FWG38_09575 [Defluviitaleaceae bacterium]|nr:hypothetical protein [Defluviitaleaceae bacterium]